jgi:hypothetical protein
MQIDRKTLFVLIAAVAFGYWMAGRPATPPAPDRPAVRWIVRAAKNLLWIAAFADPPPAEAQGDRRLVQAPLVGDDGYRIVDHGRGL